jgi:hypothetical protein
MLDIRPVVAGKDNCCSPLKDNRMTAAFHLRPGSAPTGSSFTGEDCQESHFDRECFVNIPIQVIAQFLKTSDALQDFGRAEPACQHGSVFSCTRQTALRNTISGP